MKTSNKELDSIQLNQVIEQLKEMSDSDLQVCHNNYCIELCYEDEVYDNDEYNINEHFNTPFDVLLALEHYNLSDDYFYFHNGNLISFNYLTGEDSPITFSDLAQWLINEDKLSDYDIEVVTIDDMLASIEDNINDIDSVGNIIRLLNYLDIDYLSLTEWLTNDRNDIDSYIQNYIDFIIDIISSDMDYDTLVNLCDYFNIEY